MTGEWFVIERGEGRPLVLLHGVGSASSAWIPVVDRLAESRRVFAFDLPGCGNTPPLAPTVEPTPAAIARSLVIELAARGVEPPFDVVGNSLGGFVALEVAKAGHARSVVALSPAGLWHGRGPRSVAPTLRLTRAVCRRAPRLTRVVLRTAPGRALGLPVVMAWRGWRVPAEHAIEAAENFARCADFDRLVDAATSGFRGGREIEVPVTVAFGQHDLILRRRICQHRDELPAHARWVRLPGCGHVPMWDNPNTVAQVVLAGTN